MPGGYVAGCKFTDENEYKAALEDLRIINRLKAETDMNDAGSVNKLYSLLQSGEIRFKTEVGRNFDDEIFDLTKKLEKEESSKAKESKGLKLKSAKEPKGIKLKASKEGGNSTKERPSKSKKKSAKETVTAPQKTKSELIDEATNAVKVRSAQGGQPVSAQKTDKEIDAAAKEILRKSAFRRNIIVSVCGVVAVLSLGYFIFYSRSAYLAQAEYDELASLKGSDPVAEEIEQKPLFTLAEAEEIPEVLDEYKNIYIKNKSVIGWLTIEGTGIDYPVMQTVNNDYYLDHDFNGKEDKNGSIFLDCNCNAMFRSTNLIIYGHHMKSGKMFGNLKKYESEDYCKEHNVIQFDTIYEKGLYEVMYVFRDNIKDAEDVSFKYYQFIDAASKEEFESNMKAMSEMSLYDTGVTASYGDDILTLSTCNGSTSTARFVVVAKRIPASEVTYVYN